MAFAVLGQILPLRLFMRLFVNFTLQSKLWSSPCSAGLCEENDLSPFCCGPYCSQLRQLHTRYLSGNLEESTDGSGIKPGQTKKKT